MQMACDVIFARTINQPVNILEIKSKSYFTKALQKYRNVVGA